MKTNNNGINSKVIKTICAILLLLYVIYLLYLVFFSHHYGRGVVHRSCNFVPLKTIIAFLQMQSNYDIIFINLVGNIVAFIPMGFLLPIVFAKISSIRKTISVVFLATFFIEVTQYILGVGMCDIDDVILNTLGGIIGFIIYDLHRIIKKYMIKKT